MRTKTINAKGRQTNPATRKEIQVRQTFQIIDDNTHMMEMFMTPAGGKEFKSKEFTFTRKYINPSF